MAVTPPIQRFDHWTLVARDPERSRRFYTQVLGAEELPLGEGFLSVQLAGTIIDLFPANDAPWPGQPAPGSGGQHHAYIIALADYDRWLAHFAAHGVPTRGMAHGLIRMSMYVEDPDGYHIELTVPFQDRVLARSEITKRGLEEGIERRPPWEAMRGEPRSEPD